MPLLRHRDSGLKFRTLYEIFQEVVRMAVVRDASQISDTSKLNIGMNTTSWPLLNILKSGRKDKYAVIVLNRPIQSEIKLVETLWSRASLKACVDGGTNEIYDNLDHSKFIPDLITGDFDSIRPEVLDFYRQKGVEIVKTEDQNYTDFTKCLKVIVEKQKQIDYITVVCCMGGRLDQIFSNIDTLFQAYGMAPSIPVYLLSDHSMACLLQQGRHELQVKSCYEGEWCGLIPVGESCDNVTTTGLKWNLEHDRLRFGELICTSNTWNGSDCVTIETDKPLLWTMGMSVKHM